MNGVFGKDWEELPRSGGPAGPRCLGTAIDHGETSMDLADALSHELPGDSDEISYLVELTMEKGGIKMSSAAPLIIFDAYFVNQEKSGAVNAPSVTT